MVVYVDVAFAINFLVDACLLLVTGMCLRRSVKIWRVFAAAFLGSLYAVATLWPHTDLLRGFFAKWLLSVLMVEVALADRVRGTFGYTYVQRLVQMVAAFYAVTFVAGGAVYALHNLLAPSSSPFAGLALVDGRIAWWTSISTVFIVLSIPIGLMTFRYLWKQGVLLRRDDKHLCQVEYRLLGQSVGVSALIDTGNALVDPLSKTPVAVAHATAVRQLLPDALRKSIGQGVDPLQAIYGNSEVLGELARRVSIVPYQGVGGSTGYLLALRLDDAVLMDKERQVSLMPMLLALQQGRVSRTGNYDCILPAGVLEMTPVEGRESVVDTRSSAASGQASHTSHSA